MVFSNSTKMDLIISPTTKKKLKKLSSSTSSTISTTSDANDLMNITDLSSEEDPLNKICAYLLSNTNIRPEIGVICGSGLSNLSQTLVESDIIKYEDIPGFPRATVMGHEGELVFGKLQDSSVVCMRGRFHTYEGHDIQSTTLPIRIMSIIGVKYLIVTNAAGGLNEKYSVGDLMVITDHLNVPGLAGKHPLVGPNDERFGERFIPLSECYDKTLQKIAYHAAKKLQIGHKLQSQGVYCFVSGPTYETPTEAKFLRLVGGDAVGMSTVPEVVVAAHCGIRVLGLSLITNKVLFPGQEGIPASHHEVLEAVKQTQSEIQSFVSQIILDLSHQSVHDPDFVEENNKYVLSNRRKKDSFDYLLHQYSYEKKKIGSSIYIKEKSKKENILLSFGIISAAILTTIAVQFVKSKS